MKTFIRKDGQKFNIPNALYEAIVRKGLMEDETANPTNASNTNNVTSNSTNANKTSNKNNLKNIENHPLYQVTVNALKNSGYTFSGNPDKDYAVVSDVISNFPSNIKSNEIQNYVKQRTAPDKYPRSVVLKKVEAIEIDKIEAYGIKELFDSVIKSDEYNNLSIFKISGTLSNSSEQGLLILQDKYTRLERLAKRVLELEEKYRIPTYLYYYEGYTTGEISKILKTNQSTIQTRLAKARELLKIELGG